MSKEYDSAWINTLRDQPLKIPTRICIQARLCRFTRQAAISAILGCETPVTGMDISSSDLRCSVQPIAVSVKKHYRERLRCCGCIPSLQVDAICCPHVEFTQRTIDMRLCKRNVNVTGKV